MILQNIVLKETDKTKHSLYYRTSGKFEEEAGSIVLKSGDTLDLQTYFNVFSCGKWNKYAGIQEVSLAIEFEGQIQIEVWYLKKSGKAEKIAETTGNHDSCAVEKVRAIPVRSQGVLGVKVNALGKGARIYGGYFETDRTPAGDIKIGIGICTFRREEYVKRNMNLLKKEVFSNSASQVREHLKVCIADNAGTLETEELETPEIKIIKNKNLGGVGGFTRDMLEYLEDDRMVSHILLMDDDAVIAPESLERTFALLSLLKPEFRDYTIGGALLRLDRPLIQYESGADWNNGDIFAHNHDFDLSVLDTVIENEEEMPTEYTGWWYSCIPVTLIRRKGLPLPLFIHRDDIEYGLRSEGRFIFLNGICVWHEAFENKLPGFLEYYDVRNLAIVNAIHSPDYQARDFKKMLFVQVSSNIGKYRYKYVDLNLKGAVDFLKGFGWFYRLDTLENHELLKVYNYTVEDAENYVGYLGLKEKELRLSPNEEERLPGKLERIWKVITMNGHFFPAFKTKIKTVRPNPNIYELYRQREVLFVDNTGKALHVKRSRAELIKAYLKLFRVFRLIDKRYEKASRSYRENFSKLTSKTFWKKYLDMTDDGKDGKNGN